MRIIALLSIFYLVYRFFIKKVKKTVEKQSPPKEGEMVQDPICKTYIIKEGSFTEKYAGKLYYFCSLECKKEFLRNKR